MKDPNSKQPVTIRLDPNTIKRLKTLAVNGTSVSLLINTAVRAWLGEGHSFALNHEDRPAITAEEIEAVLPVLKALGKPVHVGLFFELIETQQGR